MKIKEGILSLSETPITTGANYPRTPKDVESIWQNEIHSEIFWKPLWRKTIKWRNPTLNLENIPLSIIFSAKDENSEPLQEFLSSGNVIPDQSFHISRQKNDQQERTEPCFILSDSSSNYYFCSLYYLRRIICLCLYFLRNKVVNLLKHCIDCFIFCKSLPLLWQWLDKEKGRCNVRNDWSKLIWYSKMTTNEISLPVTTTNNWS